MIVILNRKYTSFFLEREKYNSSHFFAGKNYYKKIFIPCDIFFYCGDILNEKVTAILFISMFFLGFFRRKKHENLFLLFRL
jgi:hypothetical protein